MKGNKEDEKRFEELMKRDKNVNLTIDEIEFMGRHDLIRFCGEYPDEAEHYMDLFMYDWS